MKELTKSSTLEEVLVWLKEEERRLDDTGDYQNKVRAEALARAASTFHYAMKGVTADKIILDEMQLVESSINNAATKTGRTSSKHSNNGSNGESAVHVGRLDHRAVLQDGDEENDSNSESSSGGKQDGNSSFSNSENGGRQILGLLSERGEQDRGTKRTHEFPQNGYAEAELNGVSYGVVLWEKPEYIKVFGAPGKFFAPHYVVSVFSQRNANRIADDDLDKYGPNTNTLQAEEFSSFEELLDEWWPIEVWKHGRPWEPDTYLVINFGDRRFGGVEREGTDDEGNDGKTISMNEVKALRVKLVAEHLEKYGHLPFPPKLAKMVLEANEKERGIPKEESKAGPSAGPQQDNREGSEDILPAKTKEYPHWLNGGARERQIWNAAYKKGHTDGWELRKKLHDRPDYFGHTKKAYPEATEDLTGKPSKAKARPQNKRAKTRKRKDVSRRGEKRSPPTKRRGK